MEKSNRQEPQFINYHDGSNLTHYLGNDDYRKKKKEEKLSEKEEENVGRIAYGNEVTEQPQEKH